MSASRLLPKGVHNKRGIKQTVLMLLHLFLKYQSNAINEYFNQQMMSFNLNIDDIF